MYTFVWVGFDGLRRVEGLESCNKVFQFLPLLLSRQLLRVHCIGRYLIEGYFVNLIPHLPHAETFTPQLIKLTSEYLLQLILSLYQMTFGTFVDINFPHNAEFLATYGQCHEVFLAGR